MYLCTSSVYLLGLGRSFSRDPGLDTERKAGARRAGRRAWGREVPQRVEDAVSSFHRPFVAKLDIYKEVARRFYSADDFGGKSRRPRCDQLLKGLGAGNANRILRPPSWAASETVLSSATSLRSECAQQIDLVRSSGIVIAPFQMGRLIQLRSRPLRGSRSTLPRRPELSIRNLEPSRYGMPNVLRRQPEPRITSDESESRSFEVQRFILQDEQLCHFGVGN